MIKEQSNLLVFKVGFVFNGSVTSRNQCQRHCVALDSVLDSNEH